MCLAGTVEASWSLTQEVAGSSPFTIITNSVKRFRESSKLTSLQRIQEFQRNCEVDFSCTDEDAFNTLSFHYRPQTKLRKGYFFTPVCHCVHGMGACPSACWDTHPLGRHPPGQTPPSRHPPPSRHHPAVTLPSRHPLRQTPPGQTSPR